MFIECTTGHDFLYMGNFFFSFSQEILVNTQREISCLFAMLISSIYCTIIIEFCDFVITQLRYTRSVKIHIASFCNRLDVYKKLKMGKNGNQYLWRLNGSLDSKCRPYTVFSNINYSNTFLLEVADVSRYR